MKKIIKIKGMTCAHCQQRVSRALNQIDGVKAKVSFKKGQAIVQLSRQITDDLLMEKIRNEGYEPTGIEDKKSILGG